MPDWRPSCEQEGDRFYAEAAAEKIARTSVIEQYFAAIENQDGEIVSQVTSFQLRECSLQVPS